MSDPATFSEWKARATCYARSAMGVAEAQATAADARLGNALREASQALQCRTNALTLLRTLQQDQPDQFHERNELAQSRFKPRFTTANARQPAR